MNDNGNMKNLIIGLVVLIVVGLAAYFYISREPHLDETLLVGISSAANTASINGSFISALNSLRKLKLDDSVFDSDAWDTLVDSGIILAPQPYGRSNPFAPIGSAGE